MDNPTSLKTYLGDSVYADYSGGMIELTTDNGMGPSNQIWLEPSVLDALIRYRKYLKDIVREHLMADPNIKIGALEARLKASKDREKEEIDLHAEVEKKYRERAEQLALEVEMLRRYGNKDCTAMADDELKRQAAMVDSKR